MSCAHENMADPPPGKTLRICLDCVKRIIECSTCSATITAGHPDLEEWTKGGTAVGHEVVSRWYACPACRR